MKKTKLYLLRQILIMLFITSCNDSDNSNKNNLEKLYSFNQYQIDDWYSSNSDMYSIKNKDGLVGYIANNGDIAIEPKYYEYFPDNYYKNVYNVSVEGFVGEEPWKDAYAKLLLDPNIQKDSFNAVYTDFSLYDLNNDNIPELICYFGNSDYNIHTFKDFEVERLFGGIESYIKKTTNKDLDGIFCVIGKHTVIYVTLDGYDVNFYDVEYTENNGKDREIYNQELWDEFLNTEDFECFPINYINIDEYIYGFQ